MTATHMKRRKEDHVDNLWEFLAILVKKPKNIIIIASVVVVVMLFATIQVTYQDGKWIWTKVPLSKVINAVQGVGK